MLLDDHIHNRLDSDNNRVTSASTDESSIALDSSPFILPSNNNNELNEALGVPGKRRKDNDFDDFDCESEEGLEGSEGPVKSGPSRSTSKRSRAAEVHNLSEKRRRSRINEKMKALQNLIPNSNKTDKASMLDEAIEYLKQLQLQVQMLSMRNGFSLHPMYLPGVLQPVQLPQVRMGFSEGNGLPPHMSNGRDTMSVNPECSTQTSFGLSNQCTTSNQPIMIPSAANITPSETSYGLDSLQPQSRQGSFHQPVTSEEMYREHMLRQQQFYANQTLRNISGDYKMKTMAAAPLSSDPVGLEQTNCVEASILHRERSQGMLLKDVDNSQTFTQHLHSLQTGRNLPNKDPAR